MRVLEGRWWETRPDIWRDVEGEGYSEAGWPGEFGPLSTLCADLREQRGWSLDDCRRRIVLQDGTPALAGHEGAGERTRPHGGAQTPAAAPAPSAPVAAPGPPYLPGFGTGPGAPRFVNFDRLWGG